MKSRIFMLLLAGGLTSSCLRSIKADVLDNWTTNQISTNYFGVHHMVYADGIYVAVGEWSDSAGFYTSADGFHWTLQYSEPSSWGANLSYSGGHYVSVRSSYSWVSIANVSADGTNWITTIFSYNGAPAIDPLAATYGNNLYVVVGSTNNVACIMTSPDGVSWTYRRAGTTPGGPINAVAYGAGNFVAIGNNDGVEYTSLTGTGSWTMRSLPGGNKISYANGLFFVPLNNKTNLISVDGIHWSQLATGLTNMLGVVTYSHGIFLAQCGISQSGSYLTTSPDGTNWFQYSKMLPGNSTQDVNLATDGNRLITGNAVYSGLPNGYNSFIYISEVLVGVRMTSASSRQVALSGLVGRNYQIESADSLGADSVWRTNTTIQITNTPFVWADSTATNSARFYRGALLP